MKRSSNRSTAPRTTSVLPFGTSWLRQDPTPEARVPEIGGVVKRTMLGGKIHRATVTEADLDYEGSITIDRDLLDAAGILPNELVHIWDVTNGARLATYTIAGEPAAGVVCVNGAAAHLVHRGDLVVIASFAQLDDAEAHIWRPRVVFVDEQNRPTEVRPERVLA